MKDSPESGAEIKRRKGRVPLVALCLALGLMAVWALFFGPALLDSAVDEPIGGAQMMLEPAGGNKGGR